MAQVDAKCEDYKRCSDVSKQLQMDMCWWLKDDYTCDCPVTNVYYQQKCPWRGLPEGSRWAKEEECTNES